MAIAGVNFYSATNPVTAFRRVEITHPAVVDRVLIHSFPDPLVGYKSSLQGWLRTDGRSLSGGLRLQGAGYAPPSDWQISCNATPVMVGVFGQILRAQNDTSTAASLLDYFEKIEYIPGQMAAPTWLGTPSTNARGYLEGYAAYNVVIDVDRDYKTLRSADRYLLQFSALQA